MLNNCHFIGRLGKEPEIRYTQAGKAVTSISLAITEKFTKDGEKKEHTEWVNCTAFGKLAEIVGEYAKKGSLVFVGGKLRTEKWKDKAGQDRYTTKIVIDDFKVLDGFKGKVEAPSNQEPKDYPPSQPMNDVPFDDDLPFN